MPTFDVSVESASAQVSATSTVHPHAYIATSKGLKLVLPFAPVEVQHGGWADGWAALDRPGRAPLIVRNSDGLATMEFTCRVIGGSRGSYSRQTSVETLLAKLREIARSGQTCVVSHGPSEAGTWVMRDVKVKSLARQHMTNAITDAEVTFSFAAAVGLPPIKVKKPAPKPKPRAAFWYTVKKGDTLAKIAAKYLGSASKWPVIAKDSHNKLRNPNRLSVGQKLYIPKA